MSCESKFDPSKPVQTRGGCKARVICTDKLHGMPIVALIEQLRGVELIRSFNSNGVVNSASFPSDFDLVNIPTRTEKFLNVYRMYSGSLHCSRDIANRSAVEGLQNRLKLTYEDEKLVAVEIDSDSA